MDLPSRIDAIVEFLASDGSPHLVKDIAMALSIPFDTCDAITRFLAQYDFVMCADARVTLDRKTREFILATADTPILQVTPTP
jgi:hypothetical protein